MYCICPGRFNQHSVFDQSDSMGYILKVLTGLRRFRSVWLDACSCALLSGPGAGHCPSCSDREAPSDRHVSEQPDKSRTQETFGLTPQLNRQVHLHVFTNLLKGRSAWEKSAALQAGTPQTLHDAAAERTSALKFAAFPSPVSLLRLYRHKTKRFHKTLPERNVDDNDSIWWFILKVLARQQGVRSKLLIRYDLLNSNCNGRTPTIGDTSPASVTGLF